MADCDGQTAQDLREQREKWQGNINNFIFAAVLFKLTSLHIMQEQLMKLQP